MWPTLLLYLPPLAQPSRRQSKAPAKTSGFLFFGVLKIARSTNAAIIEVLRQQVLAEQATATELRRQNDLAEKALAELARNRSAEQARRQLAFDTNDKVSGLLPRLINVFRAIRQINSRLAEAERRAERTDDILLLMLTEKSPQKIEDAREDLEAEIAEREAERRKLLKVHRRNLDRLNEQAAQHGLRVPLELANEIDAEQASIEDLKGNPARGQET
jgi:hypothetical protein